VATSTPSGEVPPSYSSLHYSVIKLIFEIYRNIDTHFEQEWNWLNSFRSTPNIVTMFYLALAIYLKVSLYNKEVALEYISCQIIS